MLSEPQHTKLGDCDHTARTLVIEVLKAGIVYEKLLDDFDRRFVGDFTYRYAKYGDKLTVAGDQWSVFVRIAKKLNINCLPDDRTH